MTRHIGILLFDGVEELDAVGPWEVLAFWIRELSDGGWDVACLSAFGGPVTCAKGLTINAHHSMADAPELDVFLHPGGNGTRPLMRDEPHLDAMRTLASRGTLMTSVCTGSLVYAAAGLLRGRPATTHWGALELLAETDPSIEVRPDDRFVDDGDVITSAGVSAGIDMALHLVARLTDPDTARATRRGIQYDPQPPV